MAKSIEQYFADWESEVFGYGYGSGELHILIALKSFFSAFGRGEMPNAYHYETLEEAVGPTVTWLLINTMCQANIIEYGTSPRGGWLTPEGERLKKFIDARTPAEMLECVNQPDDYIHCYPDHCNCDGDKCSNPFW